MFLRSFIVLTLSSLITVVLYPANQYPDAKAFFGGSNVLLLTAHPDDECMFFAPTIQALTRPTQNWLEEARLQVHSLCLSTGDADGLGGIRKEELARSLDDLGVHPDNRAVIDHPDLRDNITLTWAPSLIADILLSYIEVKNITTILTFDDGGISGHPNHKSLPNGVKYLLQTHESKIDRRRPSVPAPKLFVLVTHPILVKYTGILSAVYARISRLHDRIYNVLGHVLFRSWFDLDPVKENIEDKNMAMVITAGLPEYFTALRAMRQHWSQLVWFRWLYVLFSRYMWVNEWVEVTIND